MGFPERVKFGTYLGRGRVCLQQGDYAAASGWFSTAINFAETNDEMAQALHGAACAWTARGDHETAMSYLQSARERSPYDADILYNLGLTYQRIGENDKATQCFQEAIRLKPESPLPYTALGAMNLAAGACRDAVALLNQALDLQPGYPEAMYYLASAYVRLEDYAPAMDTCKRLLGLQPRNRTFLQLYDLIESLQATDAQSVS